MADGGWGSEGGLTACGRRRRIDAVHGDGGGPRHGGELGRAPRWAWTVVGLGGRWTAAFLAEWASLSPVTAATAAGATATATTTATVTTAATAAKVATSAVTRSATTTATVPFDRDRRSPTVTSATATRTSATLVAISNSTAAADLSWRPPPLVRTLPSFFFFCVCIYPLPPSPPLLAVRQTPFLPSFPTFP